MRQELIKIFNRDLDKLISQIQLFENEEDLWLLRNDISNSPGNLCLHIAGNLQHFIGHVLGKTDYVRDRELEFSSKNVPKQDLIKQLEKTKLVVAESLTSLNDDVLKEDYPINVFKEVNTVGFFLIHLSTHLNYHLGQINYFRRLL
ncbi:MAG: DUF1572 family protein [Vicingaceae bacterium]